MVSGVRVRDHTRRLAHRVGATRGQRRPLASARERRVNGATLVATAAATSTAATATATAAAASTAAATATAAATGGRLRSGRGLLGGAAAAAVIRRRGLRRLGPAAAALPAIGTLSRASREESALAGCKAFGWEDAARGSVIRGPVSQRARWSAGAPSCPPSLEWHCR